MREEISKRIERDVRAFKRSRTRILSIWYRLDQTMLGSFFRNARFLLEEISKRLRYNSRNFSGARAGSYHRLRMRHCLRAQVRAAGPTVPNRSSEPESRPPRARRAVNSSRGAETLEKPPERRPRAGLHQAVVANSRIMVPPNVALTSSRAAPTAMKPTNARTHDPTKTSERIPNTIAAIPIRISIPLAAVEPW